MLKTITSFVDSLGSLTYKGLWNAATNTPTLASGVGTTGDYYVVSVPGTTTLDGISSWAAGDWAIFNGSVWEKYNNPADTLGEVLANGNTTAGTDISVTTGDDITFADNSKAIFGDGSDLQIYHDGSGSYIDDQGTGPIRIRSGVGGALRFQDLDGDDLINATSNGAVTLYYDNSAKLATTDTGIDVTGSIISQSSAGYATATLKADTSNSGSGGTPELRFELGGTQKARFRVDTSDNVEIATGTGTGSTRFGIASNGNISFYNTAGNSQALFWDASAESLGIGTTTPTNTLEVKSSGNDNGVLLKGSGGNSIAWIHQQSTDAATLRMYDGSDLNVLIGSNANSDSYFNTGGNVGIGTSSPQNLLHINKSDSLASAMQFTNSTTGATSSDGIFVGLGSGEQGYFWNYEANDLILGTSNAEAMRIDASGNLLVGTTNANPTGSGVNDPGVELSDTGGVRSTVAENPAATFNRKTDDGAIALFRKDGTTVGSIGTEGGDMAIGNGDVGLQFINGGQAVRGFNMTTNARIDAQVDLGMASTRFKDLFLSGGVVFGTTGGSVSSKTLDDYEEGTWTPADGSGAALTFSTAVGTYVKVGNLVTVAYSVTYPSTADTTDMAVGGLPFAPDTNFIYGGSQSYTNKAAAFDCSVTTLSSKIVYRTGGTSAQIHNNDLSSGSIRGSITYQV